MTVNRKCDTIKKREVDTRCENKERCDKVSFVKTMAKITGGAVLLGAAASGVAALTLYERVIPRQDKIRLLPVKELMQKKNARA